MKKKISLIISLGAIIVITSSCASKQKVVSVPAGANKAALSAAKPKSKSANKPNFKDKTGTAAGNIAPKGVPTAFAPTPAPKPVPVPVTPTAPKPVPPTPKPEVAAPAPKSAPIVAPAPASAPKADVAPVVKATKTSVNRKPVQTRNENFDLAAGQKNSSDLKYKYHVVVGSFKDKNNALGLHSVLLEEGEKNAIVVVNEQMQYRVILNSFDDYKQAHLRISKFGERFIDAWVLVQKKD